MRYFFLLLIFLVVLFFFRYLKSLQRKYEQEQHPEKEALNEPQESVLQKQKREYEEKKNKHLTELKEDPLNLSYEDILLRPVESTDEKPLSVILSNKKVSVPVGLPVIKRISQMKPLMEEITDVIGTYAVILLPSERLIGLAELHESNSDDTAQVSIVIGRQFWRHGFGTMAAKALIQHACQEGYSLIEAEIAEDNLSGRTFAESLGFKRDSGTLFKLNLNCQKNNTVGQIINY